VSVAAWPETHRSLEENNALVPAGRVILRHDLPWFGNVL
jgi:hypothetical protein